jgi:DNA-binding CsgD family transcriptional regulator
LSEGLDWLELALSRGSDVSAGGTQPPAADRAAALLGAGLLAHHSGDDARAVPWLEESYGLVRTLADDWSTRYALYLLGIVDEDAGRYASATERFTKVLAQARPANDRIGIGQSLFHLGIVTWGRGDRDRAATLLGEALAVHGTSGDNPYGTADALAYLGLIACEQGDVARSFPLLRQGLSLHLELGSLEDIAVNLAAFAMLAGSCGQPAQAARLFAAAHTMREKIANPFKLPESAVFDGAAAAVRASLGDAQFAANWTEGSAMSFERAIEDALTVDSAASPPATAGTTLNRGATAGGGLTPREREVLALLVGGGTNQDIADALFLSPRTVQAHLANVFAKLDVHSRAAAVARAYELDLV